MEEMAAKSIRRDEQRKRRTKRVLEKARAARARLEYEQLVENAYAEHTAIY